MEGGATSSEPIPGKAPNPPDAAPTPPQDAPAAPKAPKPPPPPKEAPAAKCDECGVPLTQTAVGTFHPCGHGGTKRGLPTKVIDDEMAEAGDAITVTWGEEEISPVKYSNFTVGPFTATARPRPGETRPVCMQRIYNELTLFAEDEREKKAQSFLKAYNKVSRNRDGDE